MALSVYTEISAGVFQQHSVNGTFSNPITTIHDARDGDIIEKKLFVRTDAALDYSNIQVLPATSSSIVTEDIGVGASTGTNGWGVKLLIDPGYDPTAQDWAAVEYGTAVDIPDIPNTAPVGTGYTFWMRIESPRGASVENKTAIKLQLLYTEV